MTTGPSIVGLAIMVSAAYIAAWFKAGEKAGGSRAVRVAK